MEANQLWLENTILISTVDLTNIFETKTKEKLKNVEEHYSIKNINHKKILHFKSITEANPLWLVTDYSVDMFQERKKQIY